MRLSLRQQLNIAFGVVVATVLLVAAVALRDARTLAAAADALGHGQRVLATADRLRASVAEMESAWRGRALIGDDALGLAFNRASARAAAGLARLDSLASVDSALASRARSVAVAIDSLRRLAPMPRAAGVDAPAFQEEERLSGRARSLVDEIATAERSRLLSSGAGSRAGARRATLVSGVALAVALLLAPLAFAVVRGGVAERHQAERALAASEARFRAAMDGGYDAFYILHAVRDERGVVTDFEFVELNARAEALLGAARTRVIGQRLCELLPANRTSGFFDKYVAVMQTGRAIEEELELPASPSSAVWIRQQVVPVDGGVAITSRDVTDRRQTEEALRALSLVDELTGLYNRRGFLTLAQQQLKLARRAHRELLLLFIDMDDFKAINDGFGHHVGDEALGRAAEILRKTFRDSDILARIGGDEFVVLAADSPRAARDSVVGRLRAELRERNERDGAPYRLSFSIGVAHFDPMRPPSIEELLAAADGMLYEQKRRRRTEGAGAATALSA